MIEESIYELHLRLTEEISVLINYNSFKKNTATPIEDIMKLRTIKSKELTIGFVQEFIEENLLNISGISIQEKDYPNGIENVPHSYETRADLNRLVIDGNL